MSADVFRRYIDILTEADQQSQYHPLVTDIDSLGLTFQPTTKKDLTYSPVQSPLNQENLDQMPALSFGTSADSFVLQTVTDDGHETTKPVNQGDVIVSGPGKEKYNIGNQAKFDKNYPIDAGNGRRKPDIKSVRQVAQYTGQKPISIIASWGEQMNVLPGDYIVNEAPGKYYRVAKYLFDQTYNALGRKQQGVAEDQVKEAQTYGPDNPYQVKPGEDFSKVFEPGRNSGVHYHLMTGMVTDPFYFKLNNKLYSVSNKGDGIPREVGVNDNDLGKDVPMPSLIGNQGVAEGSKRPDFGAGIGDIHVVYMDGKLKRKFKREDNAIDYANDLYDRTGNETIEVQNSEGGVVYSFLDEQQGVAEMDKSQPSHGRDGHVSHSTYGSRDKEGSDYFKGKESPGKAITAKQAEKDAVDILKKQGVAEGTKSLADYIAESERAYSQPVPGDWFAINIREETLFETWVCDETPDGIVIYADDAGLALLERYGYLGEAISEGHDFEIDSDEDSVDVVDQGEYDQEGDMAKDDLATIVRAARRLTGMLDDNDNLPEWVQAKITKAADYVDTAADYMESNREQDVAEGDMAEAKYQGREVKLGKPFLTPSGPKKRSVYVKNPKTGNIKKVNFGDPNMRIKKSSPKHRKSFRARHNCANPGPRTSARYWSCRAW